VINDRMRSWLVILVGAGWAFNLVAPVFSDSYEPNLAANGPLLLILGALFTTKKRENDSERERDGYHSGSAKGTDGEGE
jgi:hypothetical protein